ncbi:MAG TPA: sigma 54-interacting transcriptional regulator [Vicinamibacterales bacterium]|nr:sigma 54-interacting transcriptional regulator [Vicinamibacterales bacterium]
MAPTPGRGGDNRFGPMTPAGREAVRTLPSKDAFQVLQLAVESLPHGMLVVNPDGAIVLVNQQVERQFGYGRSELINQCVDVLLPHSFLGDYAKHSQGVDATPEAPTLGNDQTLYGRRRDGSEFPAEITLNSIHIGTGIFVVASVVDITMRRQLEQAASVAVDQKLEFGQLIADLSVKFINLPTDQVIEAIRDAIRRAAEILDVDCCTFFRIPDAEVAAGPIAWWGRRGVSAPPVMSVKERFPWVRDTILGGKEICFSTLDEVPNSVDRQGYEAGGIRAAVTVPISVCGQVVGAIAFLMVQGERAWTPETLNTMRVLTAVFGNVLARCENDQTLRQSILQLEHLKDRFRVENLYLRREVQERVDTGIIIGQSQAIRNVLEQARQVAGTDSTVLLLGETGTGKELIATHIHELSARRGRIMVRVNCSAIPSTLMESELFGREKGAFTGALARQVGRFELADHSTIFLDEIGELPADVQIKLLRVLEERQIERLGSPKGVHVDVRIIAATHRNLEKRIGEGTFREDLFYRLNVFPITVPPLRDRVEDIPLLVWRFVDEFSKTFGKRIETISREDMAVLQRYSWPGNIRELRNVVERAMIVSTGTQLALPLPSLSRPTEKRSLKLNDVEKEHILSVLDSSGWRIRGASGAAALLGLKPTTLEARMVKLGLARPKPAMRPQ